MTDDTDDELPQLPPDTLALLQSFYSDRDTQQKHFEDLKAAAENEADDREWSMDAWTEDWQISQFWYTDDTAATLARELLRDADASNAVAVVSAPSVFIQMKRQLASVEKSRRPQVLLLEFDERFAVFGKEFVVYDFAHPLRLPAELKGRFDRIICDPPFLSDDCQTKAALTCRWLSKSWAAPANPASPMKDEQKLISCTGERMESLAVKLYKGTKTTTFLPQHSKGLSNEFRCYANFICPSWKFVS